MKDLDLLINPCLKSYYFGEKKTYFYDRYTVQYTAQYTVQYTVQNTVHYISKGPYGVQGSLSMGPYGVPGSRDSGTQGQGSWDSGIGDSGTGATAISLESGNLPWAT